MEPEQIENSEFNLSWGLARYGCKRSVEEFVAEPWKIFDFKPLEL